MSTSEHTIIPVILAGGSGTRLWPLSRTDYPKQFLSFGRDLSLLQQTVARFATADAGPPVVVCSENHRFLTAEQLLEIGVDDATIMLEPCARNTAPAIAVAAWKLMQQNPEAVMVVLPADHFIDDTGAFLETVANATTLANQDFLVTLGVQPQGPETGYGYIESGTTVGEETDGRRVTTFIEKPDVHTARELIEAGDCFWNAGIFVFKASAFLETLQSLQPDMHTLTRQSVENASTDLDFLRIGEAAFAGCVNLSVDYAVMEHASNVVVLPFNSIWSDIGSWNAVHEASEQDSHGNSGTGDVLHHAARDTYLHSTSRLIVALGTNNISVIETSDAVLVIDNTSAQSIKEAIAILTQQKRSELSAHTTCYRPWGHYESLKLHPRFQVKRISVKPGAKLSLQKHFHRSEHWIVVKGTAIVTNGEEEILLTENESTYIPLGTMHRLFNPGSIPLELIEVQSGSYLGEDDIVRVGDEYGRA